jgi:nitrous oxidase accessory protein NosD
MQNGEWLDTVYDDALSHPLFELATFRRVRYVAEILYEYNIRYGDNDDSTSAKIKHRGAVYS